MSNRGDVAEGSDSVPLPAAQKVRALRERVCTVKVLVQPIRELGSNGPNGANVVCDGLEVAHVEAVQLVPSHGKVDDRWLLCIDVNCVEISVLLGRNGPPILDSDHLQEELRRRSSRHRWRW